MYIKLQCTIRMHDWDELRTSEEAWLTCDSFRRVGTPVYTIVFFEKDELRVP